MESSQDPAASVLQLSTFTQVHSIPRPDKYPDFAVTVRLAAPGADRPVRAPVDIVAAIDKSMSSSTNDPMLDLEKAALALVIEKLGPDDRLAVLPFSYVLDKDTEKKLVAMSDHAKRTIGEKVDALQFHPGGGTDISKVWNEAEKILKGRGDADAGRAAFILLLSDGGDLNVMNEKVRLRGNSELEHPSYPVHTFGFTKHNKETMSFIAENSNGGIYFPEDIADAGDVTTKFAAGFDAVLGAAKARPFSATGARAALLALHGVTISRIESSGEKKLIDSSISGDGRSGEAVFGDVAAGETPEFTMYLDVPEGDKDAEAMDVLAVTGAYTQAWDGKHVETARSVVSVSRPPPPPPLPKPEPEPEPKPEPVDPCKGLNEILERFEYWCKVKKDLSAMDDKANEKVTKCCCTSVALAREAALESVNRAMHHDIYTAVFRVAKARKCAEAEVRKGQDGGHAKTVDK